jgi:predicted MFS family arabinose efflux permease
MAVLVLSGRMDQTWLITGAIAVGLAFTFALPARNVTVRRLVPASEIRAGYAMDSVSYNLGRALGPPVGIALFATVGAGWAFAVNAVTFGVFTVTLWLTVRGTAEPPRRRSRVRDGFLVAYRDRNIAIVLMMVVAVTVAADPVLVLGPELASHVFGVSAIWSGLFIAALGAGSVAGSLVPLRSEPSIRLAATALSLLGVCMIVFVLAPSVVISMLAAAAAGVTCLVANSVTRTVLVTKARPEREASVMAIWAIAWAGSKPIASLLDGMSATWAGVRWTGVLLAVPVLLPIIILACRDWMIRNRARSGHPAPVAG